MPIIQWIMCNIPKLFLFICGLLLLGGCGSPTKIPCSQTNWRESGHQDATSGNASMLEKYEKQCMIFGIKFDANLYDSGYQMGLAEFCQSGNAYHHGVSGKTYTGTCPPQAEAAFLREYIKGLKKNIEATRLTPSLKEIGLRNTQSRQSRVTDKKELSKLRKKVEKYKQTVEELRKEIDERYRMIETFRYQLERT
ncbi:MAG: DUF2799 domain-containing protein [Pseudomonadota bacterium]